MAKQPEQPKTTRPFGEISDEALSHLAAVQAELDDATKDLDALDKLGMDTSRMRERVAWAKQAREIILERFGPKKS